MSPSPKQQQQQQQQRRRRPSLLLLLLGLLLLSSAAAAAEKASSGAAEKAAAPADAPKPAAAGDDSICSRKLKFAEERADNAESDLLAFRQKHEESMAACSSKLQQQQQQERQSCKEQTEALRTRLNEETKAKAALETNVRQLQQQRQQQETETARDLKRELQETRSKLQQQQLLLQTLQQQQQQQGPPYGTLDKARELMMDLSLLYRAAVDLVVASVPLSVRDAAQQQAAVAAAAAGEQFNKVYVHLAPYTEKAKELYQVYVHPNAAAAAAWASSTGKHAAAKAADMANGQLDFALNAVYVQQPHLKPLLPTDFVGRLLLLLLLFAVAYLAGLLLLRCLRMVCSCFCRRRSRHSRSSSSKKTFAADAAAAAKACKDAGGRPYPAGREASQTPQPVPPRPFDLEKRRKH